MFAVGQGDRRASPAVLERGTGGVFVTHCELLESKATLMDEAWRDCEEHDVATSLQFFVRTENDTTQKVWCILARDTK